jgi:hypothetical protein
MEEYGIDTDSAAGPEKSDLIEAAVRGGLTGGTPETRRVEAVVEGNFKEWEACHMQVGIPQRGCEETSEIFNLVSFFSVVLRQAVSAGSPERVLAQAQAQAKWKTSPMALQDDSLDSDSFDEIVRLCESRRICSRLRRGWLQFASPVSLSHMFAAVTLVAFAAVGQFGRPPWSQPLSERCANDAAAGASVRIGKRVSFKPTVRVRRFQESPLELHERRQHWAALNARNQAQRQLCEV